jgi:hypothetical protein
VVVMGVEDSHARREERKKNREQSFAETTTHAQGKIRKPPFFGSSLFPVGGYEENRVVLILPAE